ncbi:uncharacterized protein [Cebidichthys violaceus]|uniref:uncharacterized protein isoform X5 n=1 Tax=Cebidichthys violaceus TaxID=271503 RepID=UPI0035C9AF23
MHVEHAQVAVMSLWMILPISLPVFTITGIWVVYAMSLYNQHVCPVHNWLYNESCEEQLPLQRGPVLCCTLDNIPLISKCGTLPPESCFFSLICSTGSFMAPRKRELCGAANTWETCWKPTKVGDADRSAALRSRHRETPELCPQHGRPLHGLDLCRRSHHGGKLPGGFCQSPPLRRSRRGLPLQHAVCVSSVGSDLQTGQDPGGIPSGSPPCGNGPAGSGRPGAQRSFLLPGELRPAAHLRHLRVDLLHAHHALLWDVCL